MVSPRAVRPRASPHHRSTGQAASTKRSAATLRPVTTTAVGPGPGPGRPAQQRGHRHRPRRLDHQPVLEGQEPDGVGDRPLVGTGDLLHASARSGAPSPTPVRCCRPGRRPSWTPMGTATTRAGGHRRADGRGGVGLHATDADHRRCRRGGQRQSGQQPAAADGGDDRGQIRDLLEELEGDRCPGRRSRRDRCRPTRNGAGCRPGRGRGPRPPR